MGILIFDAALRMIRKMKGGLLPKIFMVCAAVSMFLINIFSLRISAIVLMLASAVVSLSVFMIGREKK